MLKEKKFHFAFLDSVNDKNFMFEEFRLMIPMMLENSVLMIDDAGIAPGGHDIDNTDDPYEAGLGFAVNLKKPDGFIGKDALMRLKETGMRYRMVQFLLEDPEPRLYYGEVIYRDGRPAGNIMAGGYGHTLGASVGVGPVENEEGTVTTEYIKSGTYEIDIAGVRYPVKASLRPMYDPKLKRVRC